VVACCGHAADAHLARVLPPCTCGGSILSAQSNDPRAMYGRRLQDTQERHRSAIRRAQQASENIGVYQRKSCLARCACGIGRLGSSDRALHSSASHVHSCASVWSLGCLSCCRLVCARRCCVHLLRPHAAGPRVVALRVPTAPVSSTGPRRLTEPFTQPKNPQLFKACAPEPIMVLAACLPLSLYSLQKIDWSWWAIFAPAYGPLYLFVVLACGLCGLRLTTCRPCELLTEEATCALPVRQSLKGSLCLHPHKG
jgi:hypothetical protein